MAEAVIFYLFFTPIFLGIMFTEKNKEREHYYVKNFIKKKAYKKINRAKLHA